MKKSLHMNKQWLVALILFLIAGGIGAQPALRIHGQVIDTTGSPLYGATVGVQNRQAGTQTDLRGNFELTTIVGDTLLVSYVGYQQQSFIVSPEMPLPLVVNLTTDTTFNTAAVMVFGQRPPVMANVPAPVMRIGELDLNRDDRLSIQPALNRIPGLLMHSGALNTNRITIRGIGNRSPFGTAKIRAYLNDIPLTSGVGETTLEDLDLSLIDRVDIWKGPTASTYGAGLGGMIHLQTDPQATRRGIMAEASLGAFGTNRVAVGFDTGSKTTTDFAAGWQLRLRYHRLHSNGYRENNQYDRNGLSLLAQYTTPSNAKITLLGQLIDLKAFIPSSLNREDFLSDPRQAAFTWARVQGFEDYRKLLTGISLEQVLVRDDRDRARLSTVGSLFLTDFEQYESRPFNILTEDNVARGGRIRFDYLPRNSYWQYLRLGAEYFSEKYDWQTYRTDEGRQDTLLSDNTELRRYYNIFLETRLLLGRRLEMEAGLNFNRTRYRLTDLFLRDGNDQSGDHRFKAVLSPRVGLLLRLPRSLRLFAAVSHGFSPPTLEETLTPEGTVNTEIQPEKGWNYELGLRRNDPGRRFNFELTAYTMHIRDLLVARRTALDQYVGINAGATRHSGVETYLHYVLAGWGADRQLSGYLSYTYADYRFTDFVDEDQDYSGNELTGTPPHQLSWGLDYVPRNAGGWYAHLNGRWLDAMPIRDDNSVYSESFQVINLKLGYRYVRSARRSAELFLGVNNVLDESYAGMWLVNAVGFGGSAPRYYYPGLPRHFYAGIKVRW